MVGGTGAHIRFQQYIVESRIREARLVDGNVRFLDPDDVRVVGRGVPRRFPVDIPRSMMLNCCHQAKGGAFMAGATVLAYNLDVFALGKLDAACRAAGAQLRAVKADEFALPVGALAGIPVRRAAGSAADAGFTEPMLVMCGMLSDQLDAFLAALREAGLRVPLKAVLTPTNVAWTSAALRDELTREHETMTKRTGQP